MSHRQRDEFDDIDRKERKERKKHEKEEKKWYKRKHHRKNRGSGSSSLSCDWESRDDDSEQTEEEENEEPQRIDFTKNQMQQEAPINYRRLEVLIETEFCFNDLVDVNKNGQVELLNDGKLVCSIENGLEYGTRSHAQDFSPMEARGHRRRRNEDGRFSKVQTRNQDIVKSVKLYDVTSNWPSRLVVGASVPAFVSEAYYGESPNVNVNIMPGKLSATQPCDVTVLERSIKLETIDFQNSFPGITTKNFRDGIMPAGSKTHWQVDSNHPAVHYYNSSSKAEQYPLEAVNNTNNVMMLKKDVRKYGGRALDAMSRAISYANVRDGFELTFEAPVPMQRRPRHAHNSNDEQRDDQQGSGKRRDRKRTTQEDMMSKMGFLLGSCGDAGDMKPEEMIKKYGNKKYFIRGRAEILYTPTDTLVEINLPTDEL